MHRFIQDESGATAIEYGLIAALVAIPLITALLLTGAAMTNMYSSIEAAAGGAMGG